MQLYLAAAIWIGSQRLAVEVEAYRSIDIGSKRANMRVLQLLQNFFARVMISVMQSA